MTKVDRIIELLEDIRNAIVTPPEVVTECAHPEEHRISLRAMGGGEHWRCGLCHFVHESA